MTTPIERAAEALVNAAFGQELPEAPIDLAKAVLESIDTNQLANVLTDHQLLAPNGGTATGSWCKCTCGHTAETPGTREHAHDLARRHIALAVKNWLTGKDQP